MIEPFSYRGVWWSPIYRRRVPGDLTFTPDEGVRLTVQGELSRGHPSDRMEHHPIILGRATFFGHGSQVTLLDARGHGRARHGYPGPPITVEKLSVGHALLGAHLRTKDEWLFDSAEVEYHLLDEWVDDYGFKVGRVTEPYKVIYKWPHTPDATVPGGVVKIGRTVSQPVGYSHDLQLTERIRFDLDFEAPVDVATLHSSWLYPLQNLLTLSMQQPAWVKTVHLFSRRFKYRGKRHLRPLSLFYTQSYRPRADAKPPHFSNTLLRYSDVKKRIGQALTGWFASLSALKPFADVFFGDRYHPAAFDRSRLLTLALAVEALHSSTLSH